MERAKIITAARRRYQVKYIMADELLQVRGFKVTGLKCIEFPTAESQIFKLFQLPATSF